MHVRLAFLFAVCLCAVAGQAQTPVLLPDAPVTDALESSRPQAVELSASRLPLPTAMPAPARPRVVDRRFIALTALTFGLTAVDVEMTQHCLAARTCYEMNPSLPDSRLGQYAINTATNLAVTWLSYRRKRDGKWGWWVAPAVDIGAHGLGIGTNIRFLGK